MKVFMLFAPAFLEWPLAIAAELKRRIPETQIFGLATGTRPVFERVRAADNIGGAPLHRLDDLEREWLATPCDDALLAEYEARLGTDTIRRVITSDRQLGFGLVSGGRIPETQLTRAMADPEMVRRYVFGLLRYAFEMLEEERPDFVFCYTVAGSPAFAIAAVSKYLGIPFGQLTPTRVGALYAIDDSIDSTLAPIKRRFEQALSGTRLLDKSISSARNYLTVFRAKATQPEYIDFVGEQQKRRRSVYMALRETAATFYRAGKRTFDRRPLDLRTPSPIDLGIHNVFGTLRARSLDRNGYFRPRGKLPERPFAYFPLHVDPEASTMVFAPMHTDQLAVIEALAKSLPVNMELAVKEHIPMMGLRPLGFYARLARIPGVFLLSPFESGLELVKRAALTAVITGTAGWEAILLKRPTVIVGNPPFRALGDGFVHCPDLSEMPAAVSRALSSSPADDNKLELYLAAMFEMSFDFPTELFWGRVTEEMVERNTKLRTEMVDGLLAIAQAAENIERTRAVRS